MLLVAIAREQHSHYVRHVMYSPHPAVPEFYLGGFGHVWHLPRVCEVKQALRCGAWVKRAC